MKNFSLITLLTLGAANSFAATTPAFDAFLKTVSNDVISLNNEQAALANSYAEYNRQLVYTAKGNGNLKTVDAFLNAYQNSAYPYLISANKAITSIKSTTNVSDVYQAVKTAYSEINQYQNTRMALFNNAVINAGGYYIVNREANVYLCTLQNSQVEKSTKNKFLRFVANVTKVAECATSHELNPAKDIDQKANVYAATITAPTKVSNVILANATYFTSDHFITQVDTLVATQKSDNKKFMDNNINTTTCNAKLENFRDAFNTAAQTNPNLKAILSVSQPNSLPRTYIDVLGLDKNNLIGDALNIAYVSLTGKTLKNANKDYDICDYNLYKSNKANNVYLNKLVDFDAISKKVNNALTPAQVYQLFIMSSAVTTGYSIADKTSGANIFFSK